MATVSKETRAAEAQTPGSILALQRFDEAIEDGIAERPARYPSGASFVGADVPDLADALADGAREGHAVVLVYPDGQELIVESHRPPEAKAA